MPYDKQGAYTGRCPFDGGKKKNHPFHAKLRGQGNRDAGPEELKEAPGEVASRSNVGKSILEKGLMLARGWRTKKEGATTWKKRDCVLARCSGEDAGKQKEKPRRKKRTGCTHGKKKNQGKSRQSIMGLEIGVAAGGGKTKHKGVRGCEKVIFGNQDGNAGEKKSTQGSLW